MTPLEIENKVIEAIEAGYEKFGLIDAYCKFSNFRIADRALQRLRKRGLIKFSSKTGWRIA